MEWLSSDTIPKQPQESLNDNYFAGLCAYALYTGDFEMVKFMLNKPYCSVYDTVDSEDVPPLREVKKKSHLFYFLNFDRVQNLIEAMELIQPHLKVFDEEQILTDWFKLTFSDGKNYAEFKEQYIEIAEWFMQQDLDIDLDEDMQKYVVEFAGDMIPELYLIFMISTIERSKRVQTFTEDNIDF